MNNDEELREILRNVAKELKLPIEVTDRAYRSFWQFIRTKISEIPIKELSEEEFKNTRASFNIPALGKMYTDWGRIESLRRRYEFARKIYESKETENKEFDTHVNKIIDNSK